MGAGTLSSVRTGVGNDSTGNCSGSLSGTNNTSGGIASAIVGGQKHLTTGNNSIIGGGYCNTICGNQSFIGGGQSNFISNGNGVVIGGGNSNCTDSGYATISGGKSIVIGDSIYSVIVGGCQNTIWKGCNNTISGGCYNRVCCSVCSFIGGGRSNLIFGFSNYCTSTNSNVVVGGCNNGIQAIYNKPVDSNFIGGGYNNFINATNYNMKFNFIGGGNSNVINSCNGDTSCSTIIGGFCNINLKYSNAHIIGSNLTATANDYSFMNNLCVNGNVKITGSITKGSGSFDISHPNPTKTNTHRLIHSFVESPTAGDNIYRYEVEVINGIAIIQLPDYYQYLNENSQIWITAKNGFGIGYGEISEDLKTATIYANQDLIYNVLIIGTRKDKVAKNNWKGVEVEKNEREKNIKIT